MKKSVVLFALVASVFSLSAVAKTKYLEGKVKELNTEESTISVISREDKKLFTYKLSENAKYQTESGKVRDLTKIRKGQAVRLEIEEVK